MIAALQLNRLLQTFTGPQILWWLLWAGLAVLTVALLILMRTRWGHSKPLSKCLALSLLAHLLMAGCATSLRIVENAGGFGGGGSVVHVASIQVEGSDSGGTGTGDEAAEEGSGSAEAARPWETAASEPAQGFDVAEAPRTEATGLEPSIVEPAANNAQPTAAPLVDVKPITQESAPSEIAHESSDASKPPLEPAAEVTVAAPQHAAEPALDIAAPADLAHAPPVELAAPELPPATSIIDAVTAGAVAPLPPLAPPSANDTTDLVGELVDVTQHPIGSSSESTAHSAIDPTLADLAPPDGLAAAPAAIYGERQAGDRGRFAELHGGGAETEAAVNAALKWLAEHQSADGRWEAMRFGAGRENRVGGEDRRGAGAKADTGVTGLALLAFLGAGHTHQSGAYQDTVRRGLEFLIARQAADGNLSGQAEPFAATYCHGMATLALGEALGMTGDNKRLAPALRRAIGYTLAVQHPTTGGWRYQKGQLGDTSQLGWQLMALKSAELAGIPIPQRTREGMNRFLRSVTTGTNRGLASYRPNEQPTRSMTAEALVCRQFLGIANDRQAVAEAEQFLIEELPGGGKTNVYYWYYATLATYQAQGDAWQRWNAALKSALVGRQRTDGDWAGSWDSDDLWGGYGGRVFTTAMGALCLEVYYRFLPLYGPAVARKPSK